MGGDNKRMLNLRELRVLKAKAGNQCCTFLYYSWQEMREKRSGYKR